MRSLRSNALLALPERKASTRPLREAAFRASSGRFPRRTGAVIRKTFLGSSVASGRVLPVETRPILGPRPAGEWMLSGSKDSLDQSGEVCSAQGFDATAATATNINERHDADIADVPEASITLPSWHKAELQVPTRPN
jgi:hypothetical protein